MSTEAAAINLMNIGNGALVELFDHELNKVLSNIKDPNTDATKARTITFSVKFLPHGDRSGMQTIVSANSKLATVPAIPAGTIFIAKNREGNLQAYSHDIRQAEMFNSDEGDAGDPGLPENIIPMTAAK